MKVGYAQSILTPSLARPVYLAGFGNNRRAETVHDDLYARSLAVQTGNATLVLVALDLIGFPRQDVYDVIRRVQETHPQAEIVIASTHTHHGPDTLGLWGPDRKTRGVDERYLAEVKARIADTVRASLADPQPAAVKWTSVHIPGVAKNTRDPEIVDDELIAVQFSAQAGGPGRATLFDFSCHPEVLWEHNPHITADYVGYLRAEVERQTGAPCIFFAGALGGMMTPDVRDHSFDEAERMGKTLAEQGLKALGAAEKEEVPQVSIQRREVSARLTNILYRLAFRRGLLPDPRDRQGNIHTEVSLIRLGGLWLAAVPGELLPALGWQLKAWMHEGGAGLAGVIGLANDELGYILPAADFRYPWNPFRPGRHYEETNSIGREIGPAVMGALRGLMQGSQRA